MNTRTLYASQKEYIEGCFNGDKKTINLSIKDLISLGSFGYISTQKYEVKKEESLHSFALHLNLINLEKPYVKQEMNDEDDFNTQQVKLGSVILGYGVYSTIKKKSREGNLDSMGLFAAF